MTHEPQHIRTATIKRNSRRPDPAGDGIEEALPGQSTTGSPVGQPGVGNAGSCGDVVGVSDGQGSVQPGQTPEADIVSDFGVDGDFGCTRPAGLGGFWSTHENRDAGDDIAERTVGSPAEGPEQSPGRGGWEASGESEAARAIAEVLRQGRSERDSEKAYLFDPGDVSETDRGVEPAA